MNKIKGLIMEVSKSWLIWNSIIVFIALVLFFSSIAHRVQLEFWSDNYTTNILMNMVVKSMIISILLHTVNIFILIYLLFKNRKLLLISFVIGSGSFILFIFAVIIDSPTLLYAT
jgi:hypothetical protein